VDKLRQALVTDTPLNPSQPTASPAGSGFSSHDAATAAGNSLNAIDLISYNEDQCLHRRLSDPDGLIESLRSEKGWFHWVNVDSVADHDLVNSLGQQLNIHPLALEDVVHVRQRSKVEEYDGYLFIVVRMASLDETELITEQLTIFLFADIILTFQEGRPGDSLDTVRYRLDRSQTPLRTGGTDYLAYSLIDAAIDSFYAPLKYFGDRLDELEELVEEAAADSVSGELHSLRRNLLALRRAVWPLRDSVSGLLRSGHPLFRPETQVHLRDCLDHSVQLVDLAETYREVCSDLRELQFAQISLRTNEVMRVLTIIATIFMPLSFIASLYGMNFNSAASVWNMPELNWRLGYPFALSLMLSVSLVMLWLFRRWGWLGKGRTRL
jgi:magnesium transporter